MTSEAKIGLLLGLVFIFIIAFIINGLPSFWHKSDGNELTVATQNAEDNSAGIGVNERKAGETIERMEPAANAGQTVETQGGQAANSDIRYVTELPKDATKASANAELKPVTVAQALPPEENQQTSDVQQAPAQSGQQTYVVCPGDSLYTIAKKFYGASEAGRKSTTDLLFSANKGILKSPDSLQIGQKLVIPQLADRATKKNKVANNIAAATTKIQHAKTTQSTAPEQTVAAVGSKTKSVQDYVVKAGDSLWKIAAKQLGNGNRYDEIAELNSDVLKDDENLTVGMHLKLPAR